MMQGNNGNIKEVLGIASFTNYLVIHMIYRCVVVFCLYSETVLYNNLLVQNNAVLLITMVCAYLCMYHNWVEFPIRLNRVCVHEYVFQILISFQICSLSYYSVVISVFLKCFVLHAITLPIFVTLTLYDHLLCSAVLPSTITPCIHGPPFSLYTATVDHTGNKIESLQISLPFKYLSCYGLRVSCFLSSALKLMGSLKFGVTGL